MKFAAAAEKLGKISGIISIEAVTEKEPALKMSMLDISDKINEIIKDLIKIE